MQITPRGFYPQQAVRVITQVIAGCFGVITPRSPKGRLARDQVQAKKFAVPFYLPMFSLLTTSMVLLAFRTGRRASTPPDEYVDSAASSKLKHAAY